jgi:nicotinamide-nucleotide amidase
MTYTDELLVLGETVLASARAKGLRIATAESCTGGLIAGILTEIPGSSDVVERGFVVYSNQAKEEMLGVPHATLLAHGAVSPETAIAMAEGALRHSRAQVSVSVTGIAGPGGGTPAKPVGLVQIAAARMGFPTLARECRFGPLSRSEIRLKTVEAALKLLMERFDAF